MKNKSLVDNVQQSEASRGPKRISCHIIPLSALAALERSITKLIGNRPRGMSKGIVSVTPFLSGLEKKE